MKHRQKEKTKMTINCHKKDTDHQWSLGPKYEKKMKDELIQLLAFYNFNKSELARALGCERSVVTRWYQHKTPINPIYARKIEHLTEGKIKARFLLAVALE